MAARVKGEVVFPFWEALVKLLYGIILLLVFNLMIWALGVIVFGGVPDAMITKLGATGAAIVIGATSVAVCILVGLIILSLKKQQ